MELRTIRGGSREELDAKEYNIGVGISLGNKWFTIENTLELINWALQHTKEHVMVYVADSIHSINLVVRDRISRERALRKVRTRGRKFLQAVTDRVERDLNESEKQKIFFATWDELRTLEFNKKVNYLYGLYETSEEFNAAIQDIVLKAVSKETRVFTPEEISILGNYILEELPEIMARVPIRGKVYDAYTYPFDGVLPLFVEELQSGRLFPEIKQNILDTEPKVFLEVR